VFTTSLKTAFQMDKNPITKIYSLIRTLKVIKHKKRQEFLCALIEGVIKSRSVIFSEMADKMNQSIKLESVERRIQDFFQKVDFDYTQLCKLLLSFVHHKRILLSIDRTEWDFGKTQVNILCVVVSIGKMAVPIYYKMLDNNSGNSNASDRIQLFKSIIELIGLKRIDLVVMDRDRVAWRFIGHEWLSWLKSRQIDFCVRVPKHHKMIFSDGERLSVNDLMEECQSFQCKNVVVDQVVVNVSISYDGDGDFLYLIGTIEAHKLKKWYKKRWTIEVFFQALKGRGFNLEQSCLRCIDKYNKLFALVCLAYTICWATGIQDGKHNPVKRKKHGYPQYSVFRRGLNLMRKFYKNQVIEPVWQAIGLACERIFDPPKTIG